MIAIHTRCINSRDDWYSARATVNGLTYVAWETTRLAALSAILRQLMVKGHLASF